LFVLLVAAFGEVAIGPLQRWFGVGWMPLLVAIAMSWLVMKWVAMSFTRVGRAKIIARVSRLWRWEFWPMWLFYAPLVPYIAWLSIRHRGFATLTAANPGIPHGGFVGESKYHIMQQLRGEQVIPTMLLTGDAQERGETLDRIVSEDGWSFPLILKPDVGQRGEGVRLIHTRDEADEYLQTVTGDLIVQPYDPGPFEAGIFYYRFPDQRTGQIWTITDKRFSEIEGDGVSTLEALIWNHPRYRMQAGRFLERHASEVRRVLARGERFRLAMAGNHCQGTMFCDGAHLITPALT
jgi:hypothetical protein